MIIWCSISDLTYEKLSNVIIWTVIMQQFEILYYLNFIKKKVNKGLCELSNKVIGAGMSLFTWGEQEIPDSLKMKYENLQRDNENKLLTKDI